MIPNYGHFEKHLCRAQKALNSKALKALWEFQGAPRGLQGGLPGASNDLQGVINNKRSKKTPREGGPPIKNPTGGVSKNLEGFRRRELQNLEGS